MHIVMYIHMEAQPFLAVQPNHPAAAALPHPASALAVSPAPPPHRRPTPTPTQPGAVAQPFLAGQQFQEDVSGSIAGFLGVWLLFPRVDLLWFIPAMTSGLQQLQFGFAGEAGECVCVCVGGGGVVWGGGIRKRIARGGGGNGGEGGLRHHRRPWGSRCPMKCVAAVPPR